LRAPILIGITFLRGVLLHCTTGDSLIGLMVLYHEVWPERAATNELAALGLVGADINLSNDPHANLSSFSREGAPSRNFRCWADIPGPGVTRCHVTRSTGSRSDDPAERSLARSSKV